MKKVQFHPDIDVYVFTKQDIPNELMKIRKYTKKLQNLSTIYVPPCRRKERQDIVK